MDAELQKLPWPGIVLGVVPLPGLSAFEKLLLYLKYYEHYQGAGIARRLGIRSAGTTKRFITRLTRLRQKLLRLVQQASPAPESPPEESH